MGFRPMKRDRADVLFSEYIRKKRNHTCEKCGKVGKINGEHLHQIEASHYIGRRKRSVRFDEDNVRVLCNPCHERMGGYKNAEDGEYDMWMKWKLGWKKYRLLVIRGNLPGPKMDKKMELMYVKQLIKNDV
jgi:5-methylcytosine-specific restriction endonuclease McrA